jgi:SAM-dependent methyltransferase
VSLDDRARWNQKWRERDKIAPPAAVVVAAAPHLPKSGRALDVAGGAGRHALFLARRGLDVTIVDVSDVGLGKATAAAAEAGLFVTAVRLDLETAALPSGPWDVIACVHFLERRLWPSYVTELASGGVVILAQPTTTNLERHASPTRDYLVTPGELERWAREAGLDVISSVEYWNSEGRHEAELVARRP